MLKKSRKWYQDVNSRVVRIVSDMPNSSSPQLATTTSRILDIFEKKIGVHNYYIFVFFSLYEMYYTYINAIIENFLKITQNKPHIIVAQIQTGIFMKILKDMRLGGVVDVKYVESLDELRSAIIPTRTCLILGTRIDKFTGNFINTQKIGKISREFGKPIFVNSDFMFGRYKLNPVENCVDSFYINAGMLDEIYLDPESGGNICMLFISQRLYKGYQLEKIKALETRKNNFKTREIIIINKILDTYYGNLSLLKKRTTDLDEKVKYFISGLTSSKVYYQQDVLSDIDRTSNLSIKKGVIILGSKNIKLCGCGICNILIITTQKNIDQFTDFLTSGFAKSSLAKTATKDSTAKKTADSKASTKKTADSNSSAKKTAASNSTAKKTSASKSSTKKTSAKKTAASKSSAKKTGASKANAAEVSAKKTGAAEASVKKTGGAQPNKDYLENIVVLSFNSGLGITLDPYSYGIAHYQYRKIQEKWLNNIFHIRFNQYTRKSDINKLIKKINFII
jgi:hypothetical protein